MEYEPTFGDAVKHITTNVVIGACYVVILVSPLVAWVMTP